MDRQNDKRTGLKTLPSRKLRMRTVIIDKHTERDLLREIMSLASLCESKSSTKIKKFHQALSSAFSIEARFFHPIPDLLVSRNGK